MLWTSPQIWKSPIWWPVARWRFWWRYVCQHSLIFWGGFAGVTKIDTYLHQYALSQSKSPDLHRAWCPPKWIIWWSLLLKGSWWPLTKGWIKRSRIESLSINMGSIFPGWGGEHEKKNLWNQIASLWSAGTQFLDNWELVNLFPPDKKTQSTTYQRRLKRSHARRIPRQRSGERSHQCLFPPHQP